MFGVSAADAAGVPLQRFFPSDGEPAALLERLREWVYRAGDEVHRLGGRDLQLRRADGTTFPAEVTVSTSHDEAEPTALLIIRDTTLQAEAEEVLRRRAFFDPLTDLPNRSSLLDKMAAQIAAAPQSPLAVFVVDLPRLTEVNATFGYPVGDEVLRQVGPRLSAICGPEARVARPDGARFAVLSAAGAPGRPFRVLAEAIVRDFEQPFVVHDEPVALEAWVGVALHPGHGDDPERLLRRADAALAAAPEATSGLAIFTEARDEQWVNHVQLLGGLRRALDAGELELHDQPRVDLATGTPSGMDALLRWPGGASPAEFIPLAERTGLIRRIDAWVLDAAVRQLATWRRRRLELPVGVNLSARTFQNTRLPDDIAGLLQLWGVSPRPLELEITETALMSDPDRAAAVGPRLRELGVSVAIDDFGAGHSPLTYLHRMGVSTLKIDRSFVLGLGSSDDTAAIVDAVVQLGHRLRLTVVAEGIEDESALGILQELRCDAT